MNAIGSQFRDLLSQPRRPKASFWREASLNADGAWVRPWLIAHVRKLCLQTKEVDPGAQRREGCEAELGPRSGSQLTRLLLCRRFA